MLKRFPKKHTKNLDGLLTGIGGKVEYNRGELDNLKNSVIRELEEETKIKETDLKNLSHPIATFQKIKSFEHITATIYWYTALVNKEPKDLSCIEGDLVWHPCNQVHELAAQGKMNDRCQICPPLDTR